MDILYLNGIATVPSSLDIERNKLWAEGSGRASDGNWIGDIKCRKWKLSVSIRCASQEEAAKILNAVDGENVKYFKAKFKNPYSVTGAFVEATCYCSDTKVSVYNYTKNRITYSIISFSTVGK